MKSSCHATARLRAAVLLLTVILSPNKQAHTSLVRAVESLAGLRKVETLRVIYCIDREDPYSHCTSLTGAHPPDTETPTGTAVLLQRSLSLPNII